eukprot:16204_1
MLKSNTEDTFFDAENRICVEKSFKAPQIVGRPAAALVYGPSSFTESSTMDPPSLGPSLGLNSSAAASGYVKRILKTTDFTAHFLKSLKVKKQSPQFAIVDNEIDGGLKLNLVPLRDVFITVRESSIFTSPSIFSFSSVEETMRRSENGSRTTGKPTTCKVLSREDDTVSPCQICIPSLETPIWMVGFIGNCRSGV